ncbi:MAG: hypothetical protein AAF604_05625 [Acidobacteriota bacterium]
MQRFRNHSVWATWLILGVIVLGGELIATHSHDGLESGKLSSVALSGGHDLPDATEHVEASTSIQGEFCPACTAGQREGVLDASDSSSRSLVMVALGVRATNGLAISGADALPPSPRGPPAV